MIETYREINTKSLLDADINTLSHTDLCRFSCFLASAYNKSDDAEDRRSILKFANILNSRSRERSCVEANQVRIKMAQSSPVKKKSASQLYAALIIKRLNDAVCVDTLKEVQELPRQEKTPVPLYCGESISAFKPSIKVFKA